MSGETRVALTSATRGPPSAQSPSRARRLSRTRKRCRQGALAHPDTALSPDDDSPRPVPRLRGDLRENRPVDAGQGPT
jgi:hypothetical protein